MDIKQQLELQKKFNNGSFQKQTNQDQEQKRNLPDPNSQQYRAHLSRKRRIKRKQDDEA